MAVSLIFTGFTRHPKIKRAGERAGWLFVACLEYVAEFGTEGYVPAEAIKCFGLPGTPARIRALLHSDDRLGPLMHEVPGGYEIHDYLEWNRTTPEINAKQNAKSKARAAAGRKGAAVRWGNGKLARADDGKTIASANGNRYGKPIARPMATGSQSDGTSPSPSPSPVVSSNSLDGPLQLTDARDPKRDHHEDQETAEQLAAVAHRLRPDWRLAGIRKAITDAHTKSGSLTRTTAALLAVAVSEDSKAPRRILSDGWWWCETDSRYLAALEDPKLTAALEQAAPP